jgi:hypothetical protein
MNKSVRPRSFEKRFVARRRFINRPADMAALEQNRIGLVNDTINIVDDLVELAGRYERNGFEEGGSRLRKAVKMIENGMDVIPEISEEAWDDFMGMSRRVR